MQVYFSLNNLDIHFCLGLDVLSVKRGVSVFKALHIDNWHVHIQIYSTSSRIKVYIVWHGELRYYKVMTCESDTPFLVWIGMKRISNTWVNTVRSDAITSCCRLCSPTCFCRLWHLLPYAIVMVALKMHFKI